MEDNRRTYLLLRGWLPGSKIGKYTIEKWLAEKEDGRVTALSTHDDLQGQKFVMKIIAKEKDIDLATMNRFRRQYEMLSKIGSNEYLPTIFALGKEHGFEYIVQEYIKGKTLEEQIRQWQEPDVRAVKKITAHTGLALQYLHSKGIVHRNVRPSSIVLSSKKRAILVGMGSIKESKEPMMSTGGISLDDIKDRKIDPYEPPEADIGYMDEKSDLYCLGICMYQSMTLQQEFKGRPEELQTGTELDSICSKLIQTEPRDRYGSATELLEDLRKAYK